MIPIAKGAYGFAAEVVLVTGSAMGIGVGIAEVLAEAGATVVIADIDGIGAAVLFLVSPLARSITNQTIAVDGGWSVT